MKTTQLFSYASVEAFIAPRYFEMAQQYFIASFY